MIADIQSLDPRTTLGSNGIYRQLRQFRDTSCYLRAPTFARDPNLPNPGRQAAHLSRAAGSRQSPALGVSKAFREESEDVVGLRPEI